MQRNFGLVSAAIPCVLISLATVFTPQGTPPGGQLGVDPRAAAAGLHLDVDGPDRDDQGLACLSALGPAGLPRQSS